MKQTIEIINPISGKGLDRIYTAQSKIFNESNYIELGVIIRDDRGNPIKDAKVEIYPTDKSQSQIMQGTGNVKPIYENDIKIKVHYYPFHYEFRTVGNHIIKFIVNGIEMKSITLKVIAPKNICKS